MCPWEFSDLHKNGKRKLPENITKHFLSACCFWVHNCLCFHVFWIALCKHIDAFRVCLKLCTGSVNSVWMIPLSNRVSRSRSHLSARCKPLKTKYGHKFRKSDWNASTKGVSKNGRDYYSLRIFRFFSPLLLRFTLFFCFNTGLKTKVL